MDPALDGSKPTEQPLVHALARAATIEDWTFSLFIEAQHGLGDRFLNRSADRSKQRRPNNKKSANYTRPRAFAGGVPQGTETAAVNPRVGKLNRAKR